VEYVSRVVLMYKGGIVADGNAHDVLSREELLLSAGFEPPTAVRLSKLIGLPAMLTVDKISAAIWDADRTR